VEGRCLQHIATGMERSEVLQIRLQEQRKLQAARGNGNLLFVRIIGQWCMRPGNLYVLPAPHMKANGCGWAQGDAGSLDSVMCNPTASSVGADGVWDSTRDIAQVRSLNAPPRVIQAYPHGMLPD